MKLAMKLAKYLADYLEQEIDRTHGAGHPMDFTAEGLEYIIQQGIEAFVSTADITAVIVVADSPVSELYF